jgi:hypothetical protein
VAKFGTFKYAEEKYGVQEGGEIELKTEKKYKDWDDVVKK